jgi:quinol monooxygenase YgiN
MYGTIAQLRVKSGMEEQFSAYAQKIQEKDPGEVASYVYRMDADPSTFYMVAIFEGKEAYVANAQRPETDARYQDMRDYLDGEPEWHDGEIVFALT